MVRQGMCCSKIDSSIMRLEFFMPRSALFDPEMVLEYALSIISAISLLNRSFVSNSGMSALSSLVLYPTSSILVSSVMVNC